MQRILKIFSILIFMLIFMLKANAASNEINKIDMNIILLENGDAKIKEIWSVYANSGTELYKPYYNLGNSQIKDFAVYENNQKFTFQSNWNINGSRAEKAQKNGINFVSDGLELCFGFGNYGNHIFTLEYTITNFVKGYNDADLIYFTLFPHNFNPSPKLLNVKVTSEKGIPSETLVWGYGWEGKADKVEENLIFEANNLSSKNYMTILVKFPKGYFETSDKINENFETVFQRAETGVNYDNSLSFWDTFFIIACTIVPFTLIALIVVISAKNQSNIKHILSIDNRKLPANKQLHYFRNIPCNGNLEYAYLVGSEYNVIKNKAYILSALLLKWINEKKITIIKKNNNSKKIEFSLQKDTKFESKIEQELYNMMLNASKNNNLTIKEFNTYVKTNYIQMQKWFDSILTIEANILKEKGLITEEQTPILKRKKLIPDPKIKEEAINLAGLKKYFKEFTLIENKNIETVKIWENYLVFATLLGVAKKVNKKLKKLYPEIIESIDYDIMDIIIINNLSRGLVNTITSSVYQQRMNSGGGGFSSFGGGGGSFGGGSGGGGFR